MRFPLKDVKVQHVSVTQRVTAPVYADNYWQMNQREFAMQVEGVADFYAYDGREVEYTPVEGADANAIKLYLNGSVYGAILHQRKIVPMHGSSFIYKEQGVMICGDAGAGKSSLTASFCLNGAEFLTDDVTPVVFRDGRPYIWAMSDRIKLWGDTLKQLEKEDVDLQRIYPEVEKFYFPMTGPTGDIFQLDQVYIIEIKETAEVEFEKIIGSAKFAAMRSEIYRYEYLQGMPENEQGFFKNLIDICNYVKVSVVKRPKNIMVRELMKLVKEHGAC